MAPRLKIIGLGAGGHARVLLDIIHARAGEFELMGFLDPDPAKRVVFGRYHVLGTDETLHRLRQAGAQGFFVGLGSIGDLSRRASLHARAVAAGIDAVTLLHPSAIVSPEAQIAPGVCVMPGAIINAGAQVAAGVCVNTRALVEHDCSIAEHAFIAPGAILAGSVTVGPQAFIGAGAIIRQGIKVGARALVGAGSVVVADVPSGVVVLGVPARIMNRNE